MHQYVELYQSAGNESVAEALLAPDFVDHTPFPGFEGSREDVLTVFRMLRSAFPDLRAEVVSQFSDGERVATHKIFHGTHTGPFLGVQPTRRNVKIQMMDIVRIAGGQIREHWSVVNVPDLMSQLQR
jgi:predicted ester cyclase